MDDQIIIAQNLDIDIEDDKKNFEDDELTKKRKLYDEEEKIEVDDAYEKLKESENLKQKDFGNFVNHINRQLVGSLGLQFKVKEQQDSFEKKQKKLYFGKVVVIMIKVKNLKIKRKEK